MEIHQARYFLAVCSELNFTRAARRCNISQPSLTRAIQKLEEEFGGYGTDPRNFRRAAFDTKPKTSDPLRSSVRPAHALEAGTTVVAL
jgi:hypothetical protein